MSKSQQNIKILSCQEAEKSFNDLIDGFLQGKPKTILDFHLAHCKKCFGRVEFEKKLKERIREVNHESLRPSHKQELLKLLNLENLS